MQNAQCNIEVSTCSALHCRAFQVGQADRLMGKGTGHRTVGMRGKPSRHEHEGFWHCGRIIWTAREFSNKQQPEQQWFYPLVQVYIFVVYSFAMNSCRQICMNMLVPNPLHKHIVIRYTLPCLISLTSFSHNFFWVPNSFVDCGENWFDQKFILYRCLFREKMVEALRDR
jgi:hypothetical protein